MKKIQNLAIIFLFCSLITACSKTDNATPTPTKSTAKSITAFVFSSLTPSVAAIIDEANKTISAMVPSGTDLTKLTATISVSDKATVATSTGAAPDFSKTIVFVVTAEDGTKNNYTVTVQFQVNVLFYNAATGVGIITDNKNFATTSTTALSIGWTDVVNMGTQVFFYNASTGKAMITDKKLVKLKDFTIEKDLTNATYLGFNRLLFVNPGHLQIYKETTNLTTTSTFPNVGDDYFTNFVIVGLNKDQCMSYGSKSGNAIIFETQYLSIVVDNLIAYGKGWTNLVNTGAGTVLFYNSATGAGITVGDEKPFAKGNNVTMVVGWTNIVNVGSNQLLFYNSKTGESLLTDNKNFTKINASFPTSTGNWTHVVDL